VTIQTRRPLSNERILEAAVRLMDREGLDAVTMRRLGRELGVEAMSLYNHVEDKDALLRGILARVLAEFELPQDPDLDWIERVRQMARTFRELLLRHPGVIPLLSEKSGPITDPRALVPIETALQTLRDAGLSEAETIHAYRAVVGFVVGNVALEVAGFLNPGDTGASHLEEMAAAIPLERFPRIVELLPAMHDCDPAQEFEHGLDLLLTGLPSRVDR
jgi:AcrR family transcriptional regulator